MQPKLTALLAELRRAEPQATRLAKWRKWAARILQARSVVVDLNICAYGQQHIVERVQSIGGGTVFWSKGCSGCVIGQRLITHYEGNRLMPPTTHCAMLRSGLLTKDPVTVGMVYSLPR